MRPPSAYIIWPADNYWFQTQQHCVQPKHLLSDSTASLSTPSLQYAHSVARMRSQSRSGAPVMYDEAGEAKKTAICPISSGSPMRPKGVRDSALCSHSYVSELGAEHMVLIIQQAEIARPYDKAVQVHV